MDISSINLLRINLIYGTVCEQCSKESCPTMSGGAKFEYLWQVGFSPLRSTLTCMADVWLSCLYYIWPGGKYTYLKQFFQLSKYNLLKDGVKYKKPVHLPAPQYIALLMDWVSNTCLWVFFLLLQFSQVETQINDEALFPVSLIILCLHFNVFSY